MAKSVRHANEQRLAVKRGIAPAPLEPERKEYEFVDHAYKLPLNSSFSTYWTGGKQRARLTDAEARFFLDNGAIVEVVSGG